LDEMYELPSRTGIAKIVIDEAVVREGAPPKRIPRDAASEAEAATAPSDRQAS